MKVNLLGKFKWYIVGFILMAIMLSVSLSFCTWDTLSLKASMNAKGGSYNNFIIQLIEDKDNNKAISVSDIVEYGRFYQEADAIATGKTAPQRWIVVDYNKTTKVATLLAEKVVVFGNFWGSKASDQPFSTSYYHSTMRSWLNSGKGSLKGSGLNWRDNERYADNVRKDGIGSSFGINQSQVNRGFLDVAFSEQEKKILVPKNMDSLKVQSATGLIVDKTSDGRTYINDLVWLPTLSEIYGDTLPLNHSITEDSQRTQFEHFKEVIWAWQVSCSQLTIGATEYALNASKTSYVNNGGGTTTNSSAIGANWAVRTPDPNISDKIFHTLMVSELGKYVYYPAEATNIGVRPAVCVQLQESSSE